KRAYCLKTQPATGETYPKSDLFNKAFTDMPTKTGKPSACLSSGRIIHIISGRLSLPDLNS
ncbi:hypothetical protein, partial [Klebsiella pneumoniae]|uniref:hypothetical protein n=1 Tax=Klebsiella pneumoniae TaxID=573 RepID=UPI001C837DFD